MNRLKLSQSDRQKKLRSFLFAAQTLLAAVLHGCSPEVKYLNVSSGNGDGYSGKITKYQYYNPSSPCGTRDLSGSPLPNSTIFDDGQVRLVRNNCVDQTPQVLSPQQYSLDHANGQILYSNLAFAKQPESTTIQIARSTCPSGLSEISGAHRIDIFSSSQDLLSSAWFRHSGIVPSLVGSVLGTPLFAVTRNDSSQLDSWRRISQFPDLASGRTYSLSFIVRNATNSQVRVMLYQDITLDMSVVVNVSTGVATVTHQAGVTNVETRVDSVDTSKLVTVYFRPTVTPMKPDIGITPESATLNAFVEMTDVRLVDTADYCR